MCPAAVTAKLGLSIVRRRCAIVLLIWGRTCFALASELHRCLTRSERLVSRSKIHVVGIVVVVDVGSMIDVDR